MICNVSVELLLRGCRQPPTPLMGSDEQPTPRQGHKKQQREQQPCPIQCGAPPSSTVRIRSAARFSRVCTAPPGQRIVILRTVFSSPRPKWSRGSLLERYEPSAWQCRNSLRVAVSSVTSAP